MNDNMEVKKSTSRLVYVVIMLLIVVLGGTFAWLTYRSKQAALVLTIGDLNDTEIILTPYQINEVMAPGTTYTSGVYSDVSVNSGTKQTSVLLYYKINNLDTTLIDKGLSYTVVNSSNATVASGYFSDLIDTSKPLPKEVVILNTTSSDETYKVYLWMDSKKGNQNDIQNTTLDVELNGSIGSVTIMGTPMYQETLNAVVHDTNDNDATYTYQWYSNTTNSTSGGTPIEGATSTSYTIGSGLVGKYIYVVVDVHDMDYTGRYYSDITTVIEPITSVITLDAKYKDYDGKEFIARGAMTNSDGSIEYTYYTNSSCTTATTTSHGASKSGGAPIDAGNYYVKASVVSASGNYSTASACVSHKINTMKVPASWGTTTSFVYSGVGQAPSIGNLDGITAYGTTEIINMQRSTQINAGSYTSTASCLSVSGGRAKCANYEFINNTKDFTIDPKELTISLSASNKVYDGTTSATCNVTLSGAVNNEKPVATATGTFTSDSNVGTNKSVSCTGVKLSNDTWENNYSLNATSGTTTASITQKSIAVPWNTNTLSFPYDGSSHTPSLTSNPMNGVGSEKITFSISGAGTAVGSYTATASCSSVSGGNAKCNNYSFTSTTQSFTITKVSPVIEVSPTSGTVEAGGTATFTATVKSSLNVSGTLTAVSGTTNRVTISSGASSSLTATPSGASKVITYKGESVEGNSTITLTFTPNDTTNFNTVTKTFTATNDDTIAPNQPSVSRSDYNTFTYSADDSGTGVASYCVSTTKSSSGCNWEPSNVTSKDINSAGTYYVFAKDTAGNVSSAGSIAAYTMTRNQGKGTTLTTKYDSSSGTAFDSNTVVLNGTKIWASATAEDGYKDPVLKFGSTTQTASGASFTVSANQTISSSATPNVATITVKKDGSAWNASGMQVCLSTSETTNTSFSCSTVSSGSTATFNGVVTGTTYYIWGGKDDANKTTMAYSGTSIVGAPSVSGDINYWTLVLTPGTGIDSVSGGKVYLNDQNASISATLTTGYSFNNWTGGTPTSTTSSSTTMKMTQTTSLTANGVANTATITINKDGSGWTNSGIKVCLSTSSTSDNSTSALCSTVTSGTQASITKVATNTTYYIWAGKNDSSKTTLAYSGVSLKGAKTVSATVNYYSLTVNKDTTGISSVSGTGTYLSTQSASINATASSGYSFKEWTITVGNTPASTKTAKTTVSMSKKTTLKATAIANTATITINKDGSGWSSSGMNVALYSGTTQKYTYANATKSGSTVAWSALESGTYNIYAGKNEDGKTTLVDTGVDITVTGTGTATINYYTISRSVGNGTSLTTKYDSSSGTVFDVNKAVLSGQTIYAKSEASDGYRSATLKHGSTTMTASGATFTVSKAETITSGATANTVTVTIKKDSSNWSSSGINVALYQSGSVKYSYANATDKSGSIVKWTGVVNGKYDVYASTSDGIKTTLVDTGEDVTISSNNGTPTINYYTITRSQGTGTTLTTKYNSSSGTSFSSASTLVLSGVTIWAKSEASSGYTDPVLKFGSTTETASGDSFVVSGAQTISSSATQLATKVLLKKDGSDWSSSGMNVALYQNRRVKYSYSNATKNGNSVAWTGVTAGTYNVYAGMTDGTKTTLVDTGSTITVSSSNQGEVTLNYYTVTRSQGTGSILTTRYNSTSSTTGTAFSTDTAVLSGKSIWAMSEADSGYVSPTLKRGSTTMTASGASFTLSSAITITSGATAATVITINKDGSAWSSSGMNVALYSGTTQKYSYTNATKTGSTVYWTGVKAGTYNVYASKGEGATSSLVDTGVDVVVSSNKGSATINYYTITRSQGTGSTLTTRYDSSSGTAFTNTNTIILNGVTIWAKSEASSGYESSTLNHGGTSMTASGATFKVSKAETITSGATEVVPVVVTYQGNMFSGYDSSRDVNSNQNKLYYDGTYLTLNGTFTNSTSLSGFLLGFTETSFTNGDKYNIILTYSSGTISTTTKSSFVTEVKNNKMASLSSKLSVNTSFPSSGSSTQTLTINSSAASSGKFLHFSFVASGSVTFTNYKVKVMVTKVSTATINKGAKYTLPSSNPVRNGYTFKGWYTAESGGTQVTANSIVSSTSDHTIYAQWTAKSLTVSYDANGGSGTMSATSYTFGGSDTNLKANAFTNPGKNATKFRYYNSSADLWWGCTSGTGCSSQNVTLGWYNAELLNAYYESDASQKFGLNTNNMMGYNVTARVQWATVYTTKIWIKKDDVAWEDSGINVALYSGTTSKYSYSAATKNSNEVIWSGAAAGTYNIYASKSEAAKTTLVDTGIDITASATANATNTIHFHTLTLNKGTGISSVTGAGTYIRSQTDINKVAISATPSTGYVFSKWTVTSGNTPDSTTSSSTNLTIKQATTLKAEAKPTGTVSATASGTSVTATITTSVSNASYQYAIVSSSSSCSGYTPSNNKTYTFTNLSPGNYKVCVIITDSANQPSGEITTTVKVSAPQTAAGTSVGHDWFIGNETFTFQNTKLAYVGYSSAGYYVYGWQWKSPTFTGTSTNVTFDMKFDRNSVDNSTQRWAIVKSLANLSSYTNTASAVTDSNQIKSGTWAITGLKEGGARYTLSVDTSDIKSNTTYYLIMWAQTTQNSGSAIIDIYSSPNQYVNVTYQ